MKKVLYLHTGAELYGADNVLLTLLKSLNRDLYTAYVILPCDGPLVNELIKCSIHVEVAPYPILRRQYFNAKGIIGYIRNYISSSKKISKLVKREKIDLIHVNTIAVLEGAYISKKCKIPLIWHVHEILEHPKLVYKLTSAVMGVFATKIVTVSNAVRNHLLASGLIRKDKIVTIYNGVHSSVFNENNEVDYLKKEFAIPDDAFVIGMIGRVNAIKGQDDFLKIVCPLIDKYKNIYGIMLGGVFPGQEWRMDCLKKTISELGCEDKIRLIDFRTDAANFHCLFDVYVLPSVQADSLPTVVLEAMASKRVVLGYKCGGISEMVIDKETGYLEDIGDSQALTKHIEYLYSDKLFNNNKKYQQLAQKGYERQQNYFSVKSFIESFEKLYSSLLLEEKIDADFRKGIPDIK